MPRYVTEALHQFQHTAPTRFTNAPSPWTPPTYSLKVHLTKPEDTTGEMNATQTLYL